MIAGEELESLVACLTSVLSELESRVLALYLDGHSYEVIGEKLDCDTKTVDNALQRVKRKVGNAPRLAHGEDLRTFRVGKRHGSQAAAPQGAAAFTSGAVPW